MTKTPKLASASKLEKKLNKQMAKANNTRNRLEKARAAEQVLSAYGSQRDTTSS
jgi:hypothetical protein